MNLSKYRSKPLVWWLGTPLYASRIIRKVARTEAYNLIHSSVPVWKMAGKPMPAPLVLRRALLRDLAQSNGLKIFVETGTWRGDTVEAMLPHAEKIYSVELSDSFFAAAQQRFESNPKVSLLHGDSTHCLPEILKEIDAPALFWLDGHYSWEDTACGEKETPIEEEVACVLNWAKQNPFAQTSVILIDDARDFGKGDYPSIAKLRQMIQSEFPQARVNVEMDIIRVGLSTNVKI